VERVERYLSALDQGRICVHPAGSLYGLTFHPCSNSAYRRLLFIKQRLQAKKLLFLVSDHEVALRYWRPLSSLWKERLRAIWPAHLSMIAPLSILPGEDMSSFLPYGLGWSDVGFRLPYYKNGHWFDHVLGKFPYPLPTTSINLSGQLPLVKVDEIRQFAVRYDIYCDAEIFSGYEEPRDDLMSPSTLIQWRGPASYSILREGYYSSHITQNLFSGLSCIQQEASFVP